MTIHKTARRFQYSGLTLPSPGPEPDVESVRSLYASSYPKIYHRRAHWAGGRGRRSRPSYGRTPGGVINAITRSGTNALHGSVYEFLREQRARRPQLLRHNSISAPFPVNQFGADAGGPIIKSKLFVFGDYEGIHQLLSTTTVDIVPSAAARAGHLTTGSVSVDPRVEPYLALYPFPNDPVKGDTGTYTIPTPQNTNEDFFTSRADFASGKSDSLFGTYVFDNGKTEGADSFNNNIIGDPVPPSGNSSRGNALIWRPKSRTLRDWVSAV
jgi:PRTRC genetic system protein C